MDSILVNNNTYKIIKLLGKGKGGYSYLVEKDGAKFCLKQIHHEPCDYYQFGNKLESELRDYKTLLNIGLTMPKMIEVDNQKEIIIKEFIDGPTIKELIDDCKLTDSMIEKVVHMSKICEKHNLNIDYYPTNFILYNDLLYYIDYECNVYDSKWNFENRGRKYWIKKEEI